jgi:hypothetical protein
LEFRVQATDPDIPARPIRYRLVEGPEGTSVNQESGEIHLELTRERWAGLGSPGELTFVVEAYKYVEEVAREFSSCQTIKVPVVDPWAEAAAALADELVLPGNVPSPELPPVPGFDDFLTAVSSPVKRLFSEVGFEAPEDSRSLFAGITGWLSRPLGALGVSDKVLEILDLIEEEFLRGRLLQELLDLLGADSSEMEEAEDFEGQQSLGTKVGSLSPSTPQSSEEEAAPESPATTAEGAEADYS